MTRALEQLIEKWREESARHPQRNSGPEHAWGEAHDKCADELEAALALPGEPGKEEKHIMVTRTPLPEETQRAITEALRLGRAMAEAEKKR